MTTVKLGKYGGVQGDVPILTIPGHDPKAIPTTNRIVAVGEATGHHHQIVGECDRYESTREIGGQLFKGMEIVVGNSPVTIEHNSGGEHYTIEMSPGIYFIPAPGKQQVEYDGARERRVRD